jgi:hypothetical protein
VRARAVVASTTLRRHPPGDPGDRRQLGHDLVGRTAAHGDQHSLGELERACPLDFVISVESGEIRRPASCVLASPRYAWPHGRRSPAATTDREVVPAPSAANLTDDYPLSEDHSWRGDSRQLQRQRSAVTVSASIARPRLAGQEFGASLQHNGLPMSGPGILDKPDSRRSDMPNSSIKNEKMYEDLRQEGNSKETSARISNAAAARGKSSVGKNCGKSGSYED